MEENSVVLGKALDLLRCLPDESVDLIVTDPPFNTKRIRKSKKGHAYTDNRDDYYEWLKLHIVECHRVLKKTGSIYLHLNEEAAAYARVHAMDPVFGIRNHLNTIVWAFDYGGRGRDRFAKKHDIVLSYAKQYKSHVFNWEDVDRIPYLAPGLQKDKVRAARGKVPTDVWWMSIIGTQSKERVGWPTQKPIKLVTRAIVASSPVGGLVVDPFAGSGTVAVAATLSNRSFIVSDELPSAVKVMEERLISLGIPYNLAKIDSLLDEGSCKVPVIVL
jgi:site-specific DNA-methyltransferase (adenine-specific)